MIRRQKPEKNPPDEKKIKFPIEPVKADYLYGLTREQAEERAAAGWSNEEVGSVSLSTKDIVKKNVFTYFNLIFAVLGVLVCLSGSFREHSDRYFSGDSGEECLGKDEHAECA